MDALGGVEHMTGLIWSGEIFEHMFRYCGELEL